MSAGESIRAFHSFPTHPASFSLYVTSVPTASPLVMRSRFPGTPMS